MYLNCKTYFSFRYGVMSAAKLVELADEYGVQALALTNINCTADHWTFYHECLKVGISPVLGVEIRNGDELMYIILAQNLEGVYYINDYLSTFLQQQKPFPAKCLLQQSVWVIYPFKHRALATEFHEWVGVQPQESTLLFSMRSLLSKCVILQPVTVINKRSYNLHRLLRAIDKNILLSKQQLQHIAKTTEVFMPADQLLKSFSLYPQIITATFKLLESCSYNLDSHSSKNKMYYSSSLSSDSILLEKLAIDGLYKRYGKKNKIALERVQKELEVINRLEFNAYFLIAWDVVRYAQSRSFYYVGRGSGANSIVAYCLQITDVDPITLDLYFERFLNPYRASPPDFDIDFSWKDRDEMIDYIFKRYGSKYVAMLGMYSTFKQRAAVRELGKVFGLPKIEIDKLVYNSRSGIHEDEIHKQVLHYATSLQSFPNHLSIHPGGILISEKPITTYTTVVLPPKGFPVTQIDMFIAEDIGLYKLDILSQRGLGHIRETVELVEQNTGQRIDISRVQDFMNDTRVADKIKKADTIGCFYIESPAMRQLLKKLRCDDYITLVAASSIIRPGVAQSGMMKQYIQNYHHPNKVRYLHPVMKELLQETFGVMVYQEDVIKVAHHFAGMDMGEADVLRRAMSGKYRGNSGFDILRNKFFEHCKELGRDDKVANEVWRQIESFAGYSFSKAHSASFAVESYQSLFLKTYFPIEFMVSVINNFGGFYSTELYFNELKRVGALLKPPCVNEGFELTTVCNATVIVGFAHVCGLTQLFIHKLIANRETFGPYLSLVNFVERLCPGIEQLSLLIRCGAFRFTNKRKRELLWEAHMLLKHTKPGNATPALFTHDLKSFSLPKLDEMYYDDVLDEIELFGFPLDDAFNLIDTDLSGTVAAHDFEQYVGKEVSVVGYFITSKPVRTTKGAFMYFGTFLDCYGDWVDSVHFPDSAERYMLQGNGFYQMTGKVLEDFGVYSIEVRCMTKLGIKIGEVQ